MLRNLFSSVLARTRPIMPGTTRNMTAGLAGTVTETPAPAVSAKPRVLVVGLGNVTHPGTRHSVGQQIVEALANHLGASLTYDRSMNGWIGIANATLRTRTPKNKKGKSSYIDGSEQSIELVLVKPKPLMNLSGKTVSQTYKAHIRPLQLPLATNVIVIHDSLAHKPFQTSVKYGGSANGHNGIRSTIEALGSADFARIRVGIGAHHGDAAQYVLEPFAGGEARYWSSDEACEQVLKDIETVLSNPEGT